MATSQHYLLKHIGSFCLILFFALFRPAAIWPEAPISTAPLAVLAAWLILLIKIPATVGYSGFWRQHRLMLCLISLYFFLCGASLIENLHRYPDTGAFVRWGLTFPIIQSALVACGFLFTLPQNEKGPSITRMTGSRLLIFGIAVSIPTMTFWQIIDNETASQLYRFTIAADTGTQGEIKRSIFATSTDLGAISAIMCTAALLILVQQLQKQHKLWIVGALLIFTFNAVSGTLSGSRGFFLAIGFGLVTTAYLVMGRRLKVVLLSAPPLILVCILVLQAAPEHVHRKLAMLSPILATLYLGISPARQDFYFNELSVVLGDRSGLWNSAIEAILGQPWLGISNGGYRLSNDSPIDNVHNAYLQLGVDAGVGGLLLGIVVIFMVVKKGKGTSQTPILATILAGLLVDNFADHSLPWIAIATYAAAICNQGLPPLLINIQVTMRAMTASTLSSVAISMVLISQHHQKHSAHNDMTLAAEIDRALRYLFPNYWTKPPIIISEALSYDLAESRLNGNLSVYPSIVASDYCAYSYPGSNFLYLPSEQKSVKSPSYRSMNDKWRFTAAKPDECNYGKKDPSQLTNWISNYHKHYGERLKEKNATMFLITDYIAFFSPIFEAVAHQRLTVKLTSKDLTGVKPTLLASFYDAKSGKMLSGVTHSAKTGSNQIIFTIPPAPSSAGFLKFKLEDWRVDREKKLQQEIEIYEITLSPN